MLHIQIFPFNPFSENTYIVYNDQKQAWIIDPGNVHPKETEALQSFISDNGLKVEKILLTHAHIDHILGLQWAHDTYKVPVYLHPDEEEILKMGNLSAQRFGFEFNDFNGEVKFLNEGDELKLGDDVFHIYFTRDIHREVSPITILTESLLFPEMSYSKEVLDGQICSKPTLTS